MASSTESFGISVTKSRKCDRPSNNGFGGVGGNYMLPTALANVNYFYNHLVNKEIVGCGGINDHKSCLMHLGFS